MKDVLDFIDKTQIKLGEASTLLNVVSEHQSVVVTKDDIHDRTNVAHELAYNNKYDGVMIHMVWDIVDDINNKLSELYSLVYSEVKGSK